MSVLKSTSSSGYSDTGRQSQEIGFVHRGSDLRVPDLCLKVCLEELRGGDLKT